MKATGIVRRIDDLGRVVIPKEIRRTMRIREGDPLEIYTDRDGEVIFKKYSPIGELSQFATQYAETCLLYTSVQPLRLPVPLFDPSLFPEICFSALHNRKAVRSPTPRTSFSAHPGQSFEGSSSHRRRRLNNRCTEAPPPALQTVWPDRISPAPIRIPVHLPPRSHRCLSLIHI